MNSRRNPSVHTNNISFTVIEPIIAKDDCNNYRNALQYANDKKIWSWTKYTTFRDLLRGHSKRDANLTNTSDCQNLHLSKVSSNSLSKIKPYHHDYLPKSSSIAAYQLKLRHKDYLTKTSSAMILVREELDTNNGPSSKISPNVISNSKSHDTILSLNSTFDKISKIRKVRVPKSSLNSKSEVVSDHQDYIPGNFEIPETAYSDLLFNKKADNNKVDFTKLSSSSISQMDMYHLPIELSVSVLNKESDKTNLHLLRISSLLSHTNEESVYKNGRTSKASREDSSSTKISPIEPPNKTFHQSDPERPNMAKFLSSHSYNHSTNKFNMAAFHLSDQNTKPFSASLLSKKSDQNDPERHTRGNLIPPHSMTDEFDDSFNSTINCTDDDIESCSGQQQQSHAPTFQDSTLAKGVILCAIAILSFVGNVATLASILRTGRQTTSTVYMLLCQLTAADLLVTLFCILAEGLWTLTVQWVAGNALCKGVKFAQMFALYLSTFVLVLIGFDRLWAIRYPMRRARAREQVRRGVVLIWILSGLFSAPQVVIFRVQQGPFVEEFYQCVTYGFYSAPWQEQLYTTLTLILMFLLPLLILIATYVTTFVTIQGRNNTFSERTFKSQVDDARHKILHKAKIKSLMMTVVIVLTFVVCWTPYYVMMVIFMFLEPDEQLAEDLQSGIFFFGSSTSLLNPLIYGAFHLRPRGQKNTRPVRATSFYNSYSCKVDNSIFGKSPIPRKPAIYLHMNGHHNKDSLNTNVDTVLDKDNVVTNIPISSL